MQFIPALGATVVAAVLSVALLSGPTAPQPAPAEPIAAGHDVLVVQGDRDELSITFASHKTDPWGGVAKDLRSDWRLRIHDAKGELLVDVPLDMTPFATGAADKGKARRVEGCIVTDAQIGMLVNAPTFATAATYTFVRGEVVIGRVAAADVRQLTAGGR